MGLTVAGPGLVSSMVGAFVWGTGVATLFPLVMSAAGETPGRGPETISVMATVGYTGFLTAPPAIGLLAGTIGLAGAMAAGGGIVAVTFLVGGAARPWTAGPAEEGPAADGPAPPRPRRPSETSPEESPACRSP